MVIYIHGIGAQPKEEYCKQEWDIALFGKPMEEQTSMAYWSNILHKLDGRWPIRKSSSLDQTYDKSDIDKLDIKAILADVPISKKKQKKAADNIERIAAAITGRVAERPKKVKGIDKKLLPLPGFLRKPIFKLFIEQFLKDVAAYFYKPGIRKKIKDRLRAEIERQTEPFVLVSHSLGTVIAFEILSENKLKRPCCSLWVTMGSPLGIKEVQDVLLEFENKLKVPANVRAWYNFADRLDPVALDRKIGNDFNAHGEVRIIDRLVCNKRTTNLRQFNPHSSIGYLSHPDVRKVVHHQIGFDSFGRFMVARDVVEEFVDHDRRVPVLIEVLEPGYSAIDESSEELKSRESKEHTQKEPLNLADRIQRLKKHIEEIANKRLHMNNVSPSDKEVLLKKIGAVALRKYVSACLTPDEINEVIKEHRDLNVYAIWKNSRKQKFLNRSHIPLGADAGRNSYKATGEGIAWAVLDTGVRWDHPHFEKNMNILEVWDCTKHSDKPIKLYPHDDNCKERPSDYGDPDGHGTHVCGIIAGEYADDRTQIQGIAPLAKLVVYKVLDDDGYGNDAWIIKAIDHIFYENQSVVSGLKIHGVNLSLGGPFDASVYGCGFSPICKDLRDLWRQGTLVCVAAGNEGRIQVQTDDGDLDLNTQLSIGDPANLQDCVAVGSVNTDKPHLYGVSWFSSRGPTADGRTKPDVVAPGERILSCNAVIPDAENKKKKISIERLYRTESGTSMACPHVSGLLAAFLSVRREYRDRPDEVKQILLDNCNDLGRDRYHQGAGLPNLMKMLINK